MTIAGSVEDANGADPDPTAGRPFFPATRMMSL
jgi:hypothetical protein